MMNLLNNTLIYISQYAINLPDNNADDVQKIGIWKTYPFTKLILGFIHLYSKYIIYATL